MTLFRLVLRGIQYHWRLHLGLAAGVVIACAALTGSLLVGYSVERTLYDIAVSRLGRIAYAIDWGGRYFDADLARAMCMYLACDDGQASSVAALLALDAVAEPPPERSETMNRVNRARIYGIKETFASLAPLTGTIPLPGPQEACVNQELARRLSLKPGDDLILRIPKPSLVPAEAPLASGKERAVTVARVRVLEVLEDQQGGRFSLATEQAIPANIYVDREWLGKRAGLAGKANMLVAGAGVSENTLKQVLSQVWRPEQLGLRLRDHDAGLIQLESERLFLEESVVRAARQVASARPVLTYLVNHISLGERATPYSFVVAGSAPADTPEGSVCINQWLAEVLNAKQGDTIDFSWFEPLPSGAFKEGHAEALVHKVLPMEEMEVERDLAPHFPGLSDVNRCSDWDIGLPLEEDALLDKPNEAYWKAYGQTPKLLVPYETGQSWWGNRYGSTTAVRFLQDKVDRDSVVQTLQEELNPVDLGLGFVPVREAAFQAVEQAVDFGALFGGMSMFLIGAALLLLALLYAHGLQMRAGEMGALSAVGWTAARWRTWLLLESVPGCIAGAGLGAVGGAVYARMLIYGLVRIWPGAVAGTPVRYYSAPAAILVRGGLITACFVLVVFALCLFRAGRRPVRELLQRDFSVPAFTRRRVEFLFAGLALAAMVPVLYAFYIAFQGNTRDLTPAFFVSGAGLLAMFLSLYGLVLGYWGRRSGAAGISTPRLLMRQLARRRSRSLGVAVLTGCGLFMVQSVVSMQAAMKYAPEQRDSGAGGFAAFATTTASVTGAKETILGLPRDTVVPLRVRDGDDAGCLNLNRARQPQIYGVDPDELASRKAFASPEAAAALWALLKQPLEEGVYPALVGDTDTAIWGLQARTDTRQGTEYEYQDGRGDTFRLRCVGKLPMRLSLFQGSLLISEENFVRLFPHHAGYRAFLIETSDVTTTVPLLNHEYSRLGMEALSSRQRLRGFYAVERAYLALFLVLGGLGMMLGAGGAAVLVVRSLAERRAEFALFLAVGFTSRGLRRMAMIEHGFLVGTGLFLGSLAAAVATLPLLLQSRHTLEYTSLTAMVAAVFTIYIITVLAAVYFVLAKIPLSALRKE